MFNLHYSVIKSSNVLNDGREFATNYREIGDNSKATLISNGNLVLLGNVSLEINQNYKHAIFFIKDLFL